MLFRRNSQFFGQMISSPLEKNGPYAYECQDSATMLWEKEGTQTLSCSVTLTFDFWNKKNNSRMTAAQGHVYETW